jgi:hypothetical protein
MSDDLVKQLWESDEAVALTNQAARRIEELKAREEAIVRSALERAAGWAAFTHGWGNAEDTIRRVARNPANLAAIIKKAGEDRK